MKKEERRSETDKVNGHSGSVIYRRLSLVSFNSSTPNIWRVFRISFLQVQASFWNFTSGHEEESNKNIWTLL